jgi:hypothetical protein
MITGKQLPEKVLEVAQYIGMILLFGLLIFANGNDIVRLFSENEHAENFSRLFGRNASLEQRSCSSTSGH